MSRDELRRKREIEDARKAGTVAPEEDADGNMINPHNPEFISKRPWYLGDSGPSLKHQNVQKKSHFLSLAEADNLAIRARKEMLQNKSTGQKNWVRGKKKDVFGKKTRDEFYELNSGKKEDGFDVRNGDGGKMTYDAKRDRWIRVAENYGDPFDVAPRLECHRRELIVKTVLGDSRIVDNQPAAITA